MDGAMQGRPASHTSAVGIERGVGSLARGTAWSDIFRLASRVADALEGARRIRLLTQTELPVVPVLVVWGSNIERLPHGWTRVDGVMVGVGHQMRRWRRLGRAADRLPDAGVVDAISAYMATFRPARQAGDQRTGGHVLRLLWGRDVCVTPSVGRTTNDSS